jgi:hypothetical protein
MFLSGTSQHSWQGGVLERIERHLAFLRWGARSAAWICFV